MPAAQCQGNINVGTFVDTHYVACEQQADCNATAALVGGDGAAEAGAGIAQRYDGARDYPALRIGHRAAQQGCGLRKAAERSGRSQK